MDQNHKMALATATRARLLALQCVHEAASGHPGGSMSCMDLLTVLYFGVMRIDPDAPHAPNRDRFVLSKGHCTPALYSVLALRGFFPLDDLHKFRSIDDHYSGHPDMVHVKGVDMSTGSLGQGISAAVGMALAGKMDNKAYRVYTILGDGEIEEGQTWEAAMSASKFGADHLIGILDNNGVQLDGTLEEIMTMGDIGAKWKAFGWNVIPCDGHDVEDFCRAVEEAKKTKGRPSLILAATVKGKGVSFMEGKNTWHGKAINDNEYAQAKAELGGAR